MIRVVAVDDHPTFVEGLKVLLENVADDFDVVGTATTVQGGLDQIARLLPDIALLDIRMPHAEGAEAARKICQHFPSVKVVMLTVSDDPRDIRETLEAGARGYLSKESTPEELIAALRSVHAGEIVLAPVAASVSFAPGGGMAPLTDAEVHLLSLYARGLDQSSIAKELVVSESTLKRMFNEVQRKLGAENRVQAIVMATKKGLI